MKNIRKKTIYIVTAVLLAVLGLALGSSLALGHNLWDTCRKTSSLCYYPGDCRSYIDTNKDGICDRSQPEPIPTTVTRETGQSNIGAITPAADVSGGDSGGSVSAAIANADTSVPSGQEEQAASGLSGYFLLPVLLGTAALYGLTWILSNRGKLSVKIHRRIWNVVLLIATVISALLGIYLILEIDFGVRISLPFNPLFWHVEGGIVMAMIAVFHIAWHWRYFQKMLGLSGQQTAEKPVAASAEVSPPRPSGQTT